MPEARRLTEEQVQKLAALPFQELLRFEEEAVEEQITGPSGRSYRVRTSAHWDWDHEPYESDLFVAVKVSGRGAHWWDRYSGTHLRDPENNFEPQPDEELEVSSTWVDSCACLTVVAMLGLPLLGVLKMVELLRRLGIWLR